MSSCRATNAKAPSDEDLRAVFDNAERSAYTAAAQEGATARVAISLGVDAGIRAVRRVLERATVREAKADVTDPPLVDVARRALECAESWDPQARVLGNVRAADIARLCRAFMSDGPPPPLTDHQVAAVVQRAEPVIAAMEAGARCDKDAGLTSLHICRTCDASGWALAGVNVPPGWSRIERIDGPDSICPKCAIKGFV